MPRDLMAFLKTRCCGDSGKSQLTGGRRARQLRSIYFYHGFDLGLQASQKGIVERTESGRVSGQGHEVRLSLEGFRNAFVRQTAGVFRKKEGLKGANAKETSETELMEFGIYLDVGHERQQGLACWYSWGGRWLQSHRISQSSRPSTRTIQQN